MKLPVVLAVLIGCLVIACSTVTPVPAEPTPNIDATVAAKVAQERAVDATVQAKVSGTLSAQEAKTPNTTQAACKLTGGETVESGWTGKDTGDNSCNSCFCTNGALGCTKMACPAHQVDSDSKSTPTRPPTQTTKPTPTPEPTIEPTPTPKPTVTPATITFVTKWGEWGMGDGQFDFAYAVAVGAHDSVYVADTSQHRIQKFTPEGEFVTKWGVEGLSDGQFNFPWGIATATDGDVYVADTGNDRIQRYTSKGEFVTKWGIGGVGDGQFEAPNGIAVAADGSVYVVDTGNYRIQKFTSDGEFVGKWGSEGSGDGQFNTPENVSVGPDGNVYVSDYGNHRIQKFTSRRQVCYQVGDCW
jgi:hypothetical protein